MRPIDKGVAPAVYAHYRDAADDLLGRIGQYCSYCERWIETHLAVEHIQAKSRVTALRNAWSNFLLACVNCNSCKGNAHVALGEHFWPDVDNTLRAFEYVAGGLITANKGLSQRLRTKARATIRLVGLDRVPGHPRFDRLKSDKRWLRRVEAWQLAERDRLRLAVNDTLEVRELIVENASARGMFSIWWTVFAGDVDMRRRLREAFIGTDAGSFDSVENARRRTGGQI